MLQSARRNRKAHLAGRSDIVAPQENGAAGQSFIAVAFAACVGRFDPDSTARQRLSSLVLLTA
jgi:hypothetical protein